MSQGISKQELRDKNEAAGHFFFSRKTMKFFNSKLETAGYWGYKSYEYSEGGRWGWYFVYSNQFIDGRGNVAARDYKVAFMNEDGTVDNSKAPTFDSLREAHQEAKRLAKESLAK